jgi:hypothetical protein
MNLMGKIAGAEGRIEQLKQINDDKVQLIEKLRAENEEHRIVRGDALGRLERSLFRNSNEISELRMEMEEVLTIN